MTKKKALNQDPWKHLHRLAIKARTYSHSPYSKFKVGSAIELTNGSVFSGCNIENASYGGTVCAERVAIWKAFSEAPKGLKIKTVLVATDAKEAWPPCGFCRQVIAEFATPDTMIVTANLKQIQNFFRFEEILPHSFDGSFLKK